MLVFFIFKQHIRRKNYMNFTTYFITNQAMNMIGLISALTIFFLRVLKIQCELIVDPSLKPADNFSASNDAEIIRKEFDSLHVDRDKIARIIFHRTYEQRHQIETQFNEKYCSDTSKMYCPFHNAVKDISVDSLDNLYVMSLLSPEGILAKTIYDSIKTGDGEVGAIEECVCANDKDMKDRINKYYQENYQTTVEDNLATFRTEDQEYQNVILKYCWKGFCQETKLTPEDIDKEVQALRDINPKEKKEDFKKKLQELLDTTSEPDLKQIFQKFRHDNKGINDAVEKIFEEDRVIRAYSILARYVENSIKYYSEELHNTVDSELVATMKNRKINRITLSRCERDLNAITKEYHDEFGETFTKSLNVYVLGLVAGKSICRMYSIPLR